MTTNNRTRLQRIQWLVRWNHYRMLVRPSTAVWERHKRLVVALDQAEAAQGPYAIKGALYACPECGEGDGSILTNLNLHRLCYWCDRLMSDKDVKSA